MDIASWLPVLPQWHGHRARVLPVLSQWHGHRARVLPVATVIEARLPDLPARGLFLEEIVIEHLLEFSAPLSSPHKSCQTSGNG